MRATVGEDDDGEEDNCVIGCDFNSLLLLLYLFCPSDSFPSHFLSMSYHPSLIIRTHARTHTGDGMNLSQWLQSLESFIGAFYKQCPTVEFRGLLLYLIQRLKDGHVLELGVLRTLLKTAGGYSFADYSPAASLSASQIAGRAGSRRLKAETFGVVDKYNSQASAKVLSVLQTDRTGVKLLILLAQTRNRIVFQQGQHELEHVKLLGSFTDSCQVVMSILLEFLTDDTTADGAAVALAPTTKGTQKGKQANSADNKTATSVYGASLPSLRSLHEDFGLDPYMAWMLQRPLYHNNVSSTTNGANGSKPSKESYEAVVKSMFPTDVLATMSASLMEAFFAHSLRDIYVPEATYKSEIARLKKEEDRLVNLQRNDQKHLLGISFTRADEAELERVRRVGKTLINDLNAQKKHSDKVRKELASKANSFFGKDVDPLKSVQSFLVHCVYPRCVLSPDDAMYTAKFMAMLHKFETPRFNILQCFDELIAAVRASLFCSTESEAAAVGILLEETWKCIGRWRYDKQAFTTEIVGKIDAFESRSTLTPTAEGKKTEENGTTTVSSSSPSPMNAVVYKTLYDKWHTWMGACMLGCLRSTEYMHLRSCFVVMSRIVNVFPTRPKLGEMIIKAMDPFQEDDFPLADIKTAAQAYVVLLTKARGQGSWKEEDAAAVKARADKEKAAIAERKRKAREQFDAMNVETEQINREIGEKESRGRGWSGSAGGGSNNTGGGTGSGGTSGGGSGNGGRNSRDDDNRRVSETVRQDRGSCV